MTNEQEEIIIALKKMDDGDIDDTYFRQAQYVLNREQSLRAELEHTKTELNTERVRVGVLREKISEARKVLEDYKTGIGKYWDKWQRDSWEAIDKALEVLK